ncbi:MAG: hypothetical protein RL110_537 [Bacteroidota bacterium]|jgi:hypothetical protein
MKTVFVGLSFLLALVGFSQSSLTVFNNGGQKFFLIMNGIKQNSVAQTNVVVSGIKNGGYSVKLIFEDGKTKDIDKKFYLESPQDVTTQVQFKKGVGKLQMVSMVAASGTAPAGSVTYRPDNTAVYSDAVTTTTMTTQTVTTESSSISSGNMNGNNGNGNGSVGIQIVTPTPVPNETPSNQGNGGVNIQFNDPSNQQNLNMNININGIDPNAPNMNVNMNVNGTNAGTTRPGANTNVNGGTTSNSSTQQTTTNGANVNIQGGTVQNSSNTTITTTTTTTNTSTSVNGKTNGNSSTTNNVNANSSNAGGFSNGRMVCAKTLTNAETLKSELNTYNFEDDRVDALKIALKTKCLYAADAVKLLDLFTFDANQLEVAKFLSDHLVDYDNASSLATKFGFDATKMEYMQYIGRD